MPTGLAHRHLYSILTSSLTASSRTLILKSHHLSYGIQDIHISLGGHKSSHSRCDLSQEPDMVPFLSLGTQHVYNCQMISLNNEQRCLTQPVLQATKSQVCCLFPIHPILPLHAQGGFVVDIDLSLASPKNQVLYGCVTTSTGTLDPSHDHHTTSLFLCFYCIYTVFLDKCPWLNIYDCFKVWALLQLSQA